MPRGAARAIQACRRTSSGSALAKIAGLARLGRGARSSEAKATQCLTDTQRLEQLVQMARTRPRNIRTSSGHADLRHQRHDGRRIGDLGRAGAGAAKGRRRLGCARGEGDRLKIRRLKLSGFKSFVEPAELRIEPGLTGVVGPNGCGKSNLLEAIRWTMGESQPEVAARRRDGRRDLRRHRDAAAARFRRSLDPDRARCRRRRRRGRKRNHPADRARRGLSLPDRRPRRAREGRRAAVRRRGDRRALPRARQPGKDQLDHLRQAGRAAAPARGSSGHFRASRAAQGCRAEAARRRGQPHAPRRDPVAIRSSARHSSGGRREQPNATAS